MGGLEDQRHVIGVEFADSLRTILALGAHADDIEIGAGGTLLRLAEANPDVRLQVLIVASTPERSAEATASAEALLGDRVEVSLGGFDDGSLPYRDPAGVKDWLRSHIVAEDVDLVLSPHVNDRHQDHRFVADLAGQLFRDHLILGYEIVKYDGDEFAPAVYVPLSAEQASGKLDHLDRHFATQQGKPWYERRVLEGTMRLRGVECRAESGLAEAFTANRVVVR